MITKLQYTNNPTLPKKISYTGTNPDEYLKTNYPLQTVMTDETSFKPDAVLSRGEIYRMGWDTAVIFSQSQHDPNHFIINNIYDIISHKEKTENVQQNIKTKCFRQITTQAIDTCSIICMSLNNSQYLLAHFNTRKVSDFDSILQEQNLKNSINAVFCSTPIDSFIAAGNTDASMKNKFTNLLSVSRSSYFNRSAGNNNFSHMEFGLSIESGNITYFGDILVSDDKEYYPPETYNSLIQNKKPQDKEFFLLKEGNYSYCCSTFEYSDISDLVGLQSQAENVLQRENAKTTSSHCLVQ